MVPTVTESSQAFEQHRKALLRSPMRQLQQQLDDFAITIRLRLEPIDRAPQHYQPAGPALAELVLLTYAGNQLPLVDRL